MTFKQLHAEVSRIKFGVRDSAGKSVLIVGSGPIGLLTLVAAKEASAKHIVVTDLLSNRLQTALKLGADAALSPDGDGWKVELVEIIGREEVDVAFDAVGISATFDQAIQAVRPGGTVVALGGWQTVPFNLATFVARELIVKASFNFTSDEFEQARRWLEEGVFDPSLIVTNIHPLSDGASAFEDLSRHRLAAIKVVLNNTS